MIFNCVFFFVKNKYVKFRPLYGKNAEDCVLSIHDLAYFAMCSQACLAYDGYFSEWKLIYSTAFLCCILEQCFHTVLLTCALNYWDLKFWCHISSLGIAWTIADLARCTVHFYRACWHFVLKGITKRKCTE